MRLKFLLGLALALLSTHSIAAYLPNGQQLNVGNTLYSDNGKYFAVMQADGNLVVYRTNGSGAVWSTNTGGSGATRAIMQGDGNFVLYTASGTAVWDSNTHGTSSAYFSVDGYGRAYVGTNIPVWSSNTSDHSIPQGTIVIDGKAATIFPQGTSFPAGQQFMQANGVYIFTFQTDGNLVLYKNGVAIWHPKLKKMGADRANIDHLAVNVWRSDDGMYWSSLWDRQQFPSLPSTAGAVFLAFQTDGNLVLYVSNSVWAATQSDMPTPPPGSSGPGCYGPPEQCVSGPTVPVWTITW